ncbi:MAG: serine protease [Bacteroidetes bacterium HGW-Bacteroidetes-6]|nr:MAG: serine protease [Bacteroidetes bacterium HGW-Bacteroidetes-6]
MKSLLLSLLLFLSISFRTFADEGMWLPILLQSLNEKEMQDMGFRLTAEDIYSINHGSMKDAVVLFGGGCTAEIVSDQGLILTNHHCGYGSIQSHSSVEFDYLTDGFWAMSKEQELSNPGLKATILVRMEDVTAQILKHITPGMTETQRQEAIKKASSSIESEAVKDTHYSAQVKSFYYGNEFYLMVYEVFEDVRLVGAPPSSIGKFGGDTDNWMWPRHTGDFSVFRIYANKDNEPAAYSKSNVPYKPKYSFPISLKGVKEDDFTFVFGYPGTTEHFTVSEGVKNITEEENPIAIGLRRMRMDVMEKYMKTDPAIRIQYASKLAGVANYWKKMIGESLGIRQWNGINRKKAFENDFMETLHKNPAAMEKYGSLLATMNETYSKLEPYSLAFIYFYEGAYSIEAFRYAYGFRTYVDECIADPSSDKLPSMREKLQTSADGFFKNYHQEIDAEIAALILPQLRNMGNSFLPEWWTKLDSKYAGDWQKATDYIYSSSVFVNADNVKKFLSMKPKKVKKVIASDPIYQLANGFFDSYFDKISPGRDLYGAELDSLYRIYVAALRELKVSDRFYPDANSTLRVAYGKVKGFEAADAVYYKYYTTADGILTKEDPGIADYYVDPKLKQMVQNKDYGRYADVDGTLHTGFIATNHTTGGNSGSPVLNADGQLIGINFDRVWQGTMSDLMFDPGKCRNVSLDIRYCLWVIDKYAGAGYLIDEMKIVK